MIHHMDPVSTGQKTVTTEKRMRDFHLRFGSDGHPQAAFVIEYGHTDPDTGAWVGTGSEELFFSHDQTHEWFSLLVTDVLKLGDESTAGMVMLRAVEKVLDGTFTPTEPVATV